jgi:hypothetical protein
LGRQTIPVTQWDAVTDLQGLLLWVELDAVEDRQQKSLSKLRP